MAWVIDTCVLLDVALKDPDFGLPSALLLEKMRGEGLVVCPITLVEAVPQFGGHLRDLREFLKLLIRISPVCPPARLLEVRETVTLEP